MLIGERQEEILQIVKEKKFVSVEELCKLVYASSATVRRDLVLLSDAGLIQRIRGGASIVPDKTSETGILVRSQINLSEKKKIASKAREFLVDGESYFFDGSTTLLQLVPYLAKLKGVTVITNGCQTGVALSELDGVASYMVGGRILSRAGANVGSSTLEEVGQYNADATFFSCHGFSLSAGPTESSISQQRAKAAMLEHSSKHYLLLDHSKWNQVFLASICPIEDIDAVITDAEPSEEYKNYFSLNGIELIVA